MYMRKLEIPQPRPSIDTNHTVLVHLLTQDSEPDKHPHQTYRILVHISSSPTMISRTVCSQTGVPEEGEAPEEPAGALVAEAGTVAAVEAFAVAHEEHSTKCQRRARSMASAEP